MIDSYDVCGKALAEKYSTKYYASLAEAMKSCTKIDGICLSTPTFAHKACIAEAANLGIAIFTEKPIGENAEDIIDCFNICRLNNVPLCCGFQRRFDSTYRAVREKVRRGKLMRITIYYYFSPVILSTLSRNVPPTYIVIV